MAREVPFGLRRGLLFMYWMRIASHLNKAIYFNGLQPAELGYHKHAMERIAQAEKETQTCQNCNTRVRKTQV